ncbi:MAG: DUF1311 domain-containing protein, partial [Gammaproteobacteria bacterium]
MKKNIQTGWALWLSTMLLASLADAATPGFDCAKAGTAIEDAICYSETLAAEDRELNRQYQAAQRAAGRAAYEVIQQQSIWLQRRDATCNTQKGAQLDDCLLGLYRQRNAELTSLLETSGYAVPASSGEPEAGTFRLLRITPSGNDVAAGQQVVFQFDRQVVPVGRMDRSPADIPVTISPALNCEWRWLNTSALACQLRQEDKMKEATRYEIHIGEGLRAVSGEVLRGGIDHSFITARPKVTYARFVNWLSPGTPLIQLTFNQAVTRSSVEAAITLWARRVEGSAPVRVHVYADELKRSEPLWQILRNDSDPETVDDRATVVNNDEARRVWLVEPKQELPLGQTIWLDVSPGLKSSEGHLEGAEQRTVTSFETYPGFSFVGIQCTPRGKRRGEKILLAELLSGDAENNRCEPLSPVALLFSSPTVNSMVKNHVGFLPRLDGDRKNYDPWANRPDHTRLNMPHRTDRTYSVWLPELLQANQKYSVTIDAAALQDEFGRKLSSAIAFDFYTSHRDPNLKTTYQEAVIEKGVDSDAP